MQRTKTTLAKAILLLLMLSMIFVACDKQNGGVDPTNETEQQATLSEPLANETPEPEATATRDMRGVTQVVLGGICPMTLSRPGPKALS